MIFWCLIFSNWALRGNPGLPCTKHELCLKKTWFASENLQLFHSTQAKNTTRYLEKGNLAPAEGRPHWLQPMGGVSRSKYLESVLQRYKEVIGLLAKHSVKTFLGFRKRFRPFLCTEPVLSATRAHKRLFLFTERWFSRFCEHFGRFMCTGPLFSLF